MYTILDLLTKVVIHFKGLLETLMETLNIDSSLFPLNGRK